MAGRGASDPADSVVREVGLLFRRTRAYAKAAAREIHPDMQAPGYTILTRLVEHGPTRARDLAELFGIDKAAISRQVAMLEALGLVRREADPDDGRAQLLSATAEGARRFRTGVARRRAALRAELSTWPEEDVETFAVLLDRFNAIPLPH